MDIPREFASMRGEDKETRPIVVRPGLDVEHARPLLEQVAAVPWGGLYHAYGPATDVPGQLAAVIVGDDGTRDEAWWNLWGNIHHQGTIYEATVPTVPILLTLAGWRAHPDRVEAVSLLREVGAAEGVYVWRYDENEELVTDDDEQKRLDPTLRSTLNTGAAGLLGGWRDEPDDVRRALLWLLSVLPELRAQHDVLITETLPARHQRAWDIALAGPAESQEDADAVFALEDWVHGADAA
jgi:hypothetical protein